MTSRATVASRPATPGVGPQLFRTVVVVVLGLAGSGCTTSPATTTARAPTTPNPSAALCDAASEFQIARNELVGLNDAAVGIDEDGVQVALQNLGTAASELNDAAQAAPGTQVAALRESTTALASTVTDLQNETDLSSKLEAIATSIGAVERAAAPIMDIARTGCPGLPLAATPTGGPSTGPGQDGPTMTRATVPPAAPTRPTRRAPPTTPGATAARLKTFCPTAGAFATDNGSPVICATSADGRLRWWPRQS